MNLPPFAAFDRITVVSLLSRSDRRREMVAQLERVGLPLDGRTVRFFDAVRPAEPGGFPSIGARGCFMSHLGVLREAARDGIGRLLILEDDLDFAPGAMERVGPVLDRAEALHWSIFYGGHEAVSPLQADAGCAMVGATVDVRTTHFIGLRGAAIDDAARYLEAMLERPPGDPRGGPMHVDGAYSWFRRSRPDLRTIAAVPPLGHQRASRSDIHALRWFDRIAGVRSVVGRLRRVVHG